MICKDCGRKINKALLFEYPFGFNNFVRYCPEHFYQIQHPILYRLQKIWVEVEVFGKWVEDCYDNIRKIKVITWQECIMFALILLLCLMLGFVIEGFFFAGGFIICWLMRSYS